MASPKWAFGNRGNNYNLDFSNIAFPANRVIRYPVPAGRARRLRVSVSINDFPDDVVFLVAKNGVATTITITVPATTTGLFTDLVNTAAFAANDMLDLIALSPSFGSNLSFAATLEYAR